MGLAARQSERNAGPFAVVIAGVDLLIDPAGALFWPDERLLVVADLHLEKGSSFAARGQLLPPYDTAATLERLARLVSLHAPRAVILLGDTFHDKRAGERMAPVDRAALEAIGRATELVWISGNHDRAAPAFVRGDWLDEVSIGPVTFRHEPSATGCRGEIAGHLHPVAKVASRGRGLRRPCLVSDGDRAVLPAFGTYTGGLNVRDSAFRQLFGNAAPLAYVLGSSAVYAIEEQHLLPDRPWRR